jgi:hypothetical protein
LAHFIKLIVAFHAVPVRLKRMYEFCGDVRGDPVRFPGSAFRT